MWRAYNVGRWKTATMGKKKKWNKRTSGKNMASRKRKIWIENEKAPAQYWPSGTHASWLGRVTCARMLVRSHVHPPIEHWIYIVIQFIWNIYIHFMITKTENIQKLFRIIIWFDFPSLSSSHSLSLYSSYFRFRLRGCASTRRQFSLYKRT